MSTIIMRSALVFHGHNPPRDVARVEVMHGVRRVFTWADVHAERAERMRRSIDQKRHVERWRAARLWVAYFDMDLFGGWHAFLEDLRGRTWIDRDARPMKGRLMELLPVCLPLGDERDQWEQWKRAFATSFKARTHHRKPLGSVCLWRRRWELSRTKPQGAA